MGWRRDRSQLKTVPRAEDGSALITPKEAAEVAASLKTELTPRDGGPFPVAEYARRRNAELARRAEIAALQRRRTLPVKAAAATAAAGTAGWGVAALAGMLAGPAGYLIAVAATPAAAAITLAAVRLAHQERAEQWSGTYRTASAGAVGWIALTTALGPGWWSWLLGGVLVGGSALVGQPWMRHHAAAVPALTAPGPKLQLSPMQDVTEPDRLDDVDLFAVEWHRKVGRQNGKAPGSSLTDGRPFDNGLEFALTMSGQTLPELQARLAGIASDLDCDPMQLVLDDPPPNVDGWRSAKRATLRYVTRSPITSTVHWTEPQYRAGQIGIGPYADGMGHAQIELFGEDSMRNGVAIGSTGSGKSGLLNGLVASGRASGHVITIYLDPKVNSSPDLAASASVVALDLDRVEEFTTAVEMFLRGRRLESGINDDPGFTPSRDRPGYWVIIDECDMVFSLPTMAQRWGLIAKTGRALGLGLLLATQIDNVTAFGNNEMLRSNVAAGFVVLMRTESASSGGKLIAPDLPTSRTLPQVPGYAYLKAPDSRRASLRAAYLPSSKKCPDGFNSLVALQQYPDAPMCPIGRRAFEAFLTGSKEERRERDKDRLRAEFERFMGGTLPTRAQVQAARESSGFDDLIRRVPAALGADNVISIQRNRAVEPALGEIDPLALQAAVDDRLNDADRRVLAAVFLGHTQSSQIIEWSGLPGPRVSNSGKKLTALGYLLDGGYGRWGIPGSEVAS